MIIALFLLINIILISSPASAEFYEYNKKIDIISGGKNIGYVEPYKISSMFGEYAYLKWKREGYPEGNTFPVFLVKGTTVPLVFGVELEFLNVKINDITSNGVDLTIDKSSLEETVETTLETMPESIEAIVEETPTIVEDAADSMSEEIEAFNNELTKRVTKVINRNYYSSLHIVDSKDSVSLKVSTEIEDKEADLAEMVADRIIPLVIDSLIAGLPLTSTTYNVLVEQIPSSIRHDMTAFLLNIDTKNDVYSDSALSKKGVFALCIGNPSVNSFSNSMNNEMKKEGLPYFDNEKIIGKRTYSEDTIGIIAAIPEERVWTSETIGNRWEDDRVRFYKTMIAGVGDDGTKAAGEWYNDQLELATKLITNTQSMKGGINLNEAFNIVKDIFSSDPEASIASATLLQGWFLTAMNPLQNPDLNRFDSLGYVVIVRKSAKGYDVLETHTLNGYKSNVFLNEYDFEEIEKVVETVQKVEQIIDEPRETVKEVTENIEEEKTAQITGEAVGEEAPSPSSSGFINKIEITIKSIFSGFFAWLR